MSFVPTTPKQTREHLQWAIATAAPRGGFSYLCHRDDWGRDYATEAMRRLIHFGFTELHLHRVTDDCNARDLASARVMEKSGMRREGHLRETIWKDGQWYDEDLYAILAQEWSLAEASGK